MSDPRRKLTCDECLTDVLTAEPEGSPCPRVTKWCGETGKALERCAGALATVCPVESCRELNGPQWEPCEHRVAETALAELLERAKKLPPMTDEQRRAHAVSFVLNTYKTTREQVERAYDELRAKGDIS